jgi:hypothetical protein
LDHGTQEEDGPGTWEALAFLDNIRSHGESGDPFSDAIAHADRALAAKKSVRIEVGRRQGEPEPRPTRRGSRRAAE